MIKNDRIQFRTTKDFKDLVKKHVDRLDEDMSSYIESLIIRDITNNVFNSYNNNCKDYLFKLDILNDKIKKLELQLLRSEGVAKKIHSTNLSKLVKEKEDLIEFYKIN